MSMSESHVARRRFGQNFLVDKRAVERIVAAIDPAPGDNLVEIGPGLAALTRPLLERAGHLHVIEIDRDLAARLQRDFPGDRLSVHCADALEFDLSALGARLRIVGNLPYNISSPLLFRFARFADRLHDITVMLQKEVVERMVAAAGEPEYGRLSVTLQYRFGMDKLFDVPPGAFRPAPKVWSAVVRLVPRPREALQAADEKLFAEIVAAAFGQRRKMLRNTLADYLVAADFEMLGVDEKLRGEKLDVATYVRIANFVAARRNGRD